MTAETFRIFLGLVFTTSLLALFYKAAPSQRCDLQGARKKGVIRGGCLLPLLLFIVACFMGDIGGPFFWPLFALFAAVLGYAIGTLYFIVFKRRK